MQFHAHFADDNLQNAYSTHHHMQVLIKYLKDNHYLEDDGTLWEGCDGCTKQYRCAVVLYLLSWLSVEHRITIDRAISAPGHGKDIVDGLNAANKHHLIRRMRDIYTPASNDLDEAPDPWTEKKFRPENFEGNSSE